MTAATFDPIAEADNQFEGWARALCQFVVRAAILPVTILFTKPSAFYQRAESGEFRPLPSPFLLAVITGLVLSGITENLPLLQGSTSQGEEAFGQFFQAVVRYYQEMDGIRPILAAIPYVLSLWLFAGLVSVFMFRGIRTAELLMSAISLTISALVEVTLVLLVVVWAFEIEAQTLVGGMAIGLLIYTLIVATKFIRLLFVIRTKRGSPLAGAIFASLPALLFIGYAGLIGAGLVLLLPSQRQFLQDLAYASHLDRGDRHLDNGEHAQAIEAYTEAIATDPTADAYNARCWGRALSGQNLESALIDCNRAIELAPQNIAALDSRGLVNLMLGNYEAANTDYGRAIELSPNYAHARYGRARALQGLGRYEEAQSEFQAALTADPALATRYYEYFNGRQRAAAQTPPTAAGAVAP